jgi:hypothetical protein
VQTALGNRSLTNPEIKKAFDALTSKSKKSCPTNIRIIVCKANNAAMKFLRSLKNNQNLKQIIGLDSDNSLFGKSSSETIEKAKLLMQFMITSRDSGENLHLYNIIYDRLLQDIEADQTPEINVKGWDKLTYIDTALRKFVEISPLTHDFDTLREFHVGLYVRNNLPTEYDITFSDLIPEEKNTIYHCIADELIKPSYLNILNLSVNKDDENVSPEI